MGVKFKKAKGKRFEDTIAKKIAKTLGLDKQSCHRASTSGTSSWDFGDIYVKDLPIVVECKFQEEWDLRLFIPKFNKILKNWLEQLDQSAQKYELEFNATPIKFLVISKAYFPEIYFVDIESNNLKFIEKIKHKISINDLDRYAVIGKYCVFFSEAVFMNVLKETLKEIKNGS